MSVVLPVIVTPIDRHQLTCMIIWGMFGRNARSLFTLKNILGMSENPNLLCDVCVTDVIY